MWELPLGGVRQLRVRLAGSALRRERTVTTNPQPGGSDAPYGEGATRSEVVSYRVAVQPFRGWAPVIEAGAQPRVRQE